MEKQAFISYASEDAEKANGICKLLEQHGVRCWIAPRDITPGASYAEEIIKAIERTQALVLVMSENANNSPHVGLEVERAVSKAKTIFPVRIRECTPSKRLEYFVSGSQWIDAWASPLEIKVTQLANAITALSETGRVTGTGEWRLGTENLPPSPDVEESPTVRGSAQTAEMAPAGSSRSIGGMLGGAAVGVAVLLAATYFLTKPAAISTGNTAPKVASARNGSSQPTVVGNLSSVAPQAAVPAVAPVPGGASASSISSTETALSLAIARSLKDAENKIFSAPAVASLSSSMPTANSSSLATNVPIIDPTLPPPTPFSSATSVTSLQTASSSSAQSAIPVATKSLTEDAPKPVLKKPAPPKPKEPVYATVRAAKEAYRAGAITKYKYKEIVSELEERYDTRVRQLKLDYRAGKITKDEYGQRVRALKARIYG